ncbi:MAG: hypothetical protein KUG72_07965 [Pseudomonadales bacterium]|nr:hypothetical protein [Pseudomonadales bacterium]
MKDGKEEIFHEFENYAIPIISKYNGELLVRLRPNESSIIGISIEQPYEVHIIRFSAEQDFDHFLKDEERNKYLHLKDASIRESFLIKGEKL